MQLIDAPSPNHEPRPVGTSIDMLVVHYTGMETGEAALARLRDPAAKVSAHYMIEEDGRIFRLVAEDRRAWHAGVSFWAGNTDVNSRSIGIEIVNPGHEFGYRPFPAAQMEAFVVLARQILARHPIPPRNVVGHSDVAPSRKTDPGELFDWERLARLGIGLWPSVSPPVEVAFHAAKHEISADAITTAQRLLAEYGYGVADGALDATGKVIEAFQRHFRPARVDGVLDGETFLRLKSLVATTRGAQSRI